MPDGQLLRDHPAHRLAEDHGIVPTNSIEDGDRVEAAYLFTFDPLAAPPQLEIIADDEGFPWIWVVLGVGVVAIGALGWQLSRSVKRARPKAPTA